jgi:hypothetical protein
MPPSMRLKACTCDTHFKSVMAAHEHVTSMSLSSTPFSSSYNFKSGTAVQAIVTYLVYIEHVLEGGYVTQKTEFVKQTRFPINEGKEFDSPDLGDNRCSDDAFPMESGTVTKSL